MTTMIWIYRGPRAGRLMEVTDEEAKQAEAEGWGENMAGRNIMNYSKIEHGPHAKAEAFLIRKSGIKLEDAKPASPSPASPGYRTAEARPASPPPIVEGDQDDDGDDTKPTAAAGRRTYTKRK